MEYLLAFEMDLVEEPDCEVWFLFEHVVVEEFVVVVVRNDVVDVVGDEGVSAKNVLEDGVPVLDLGNEEMRLVWNVWLGVDHLLDVFVTHVVVVGGKVNAV